MASGPSTYTGPPKVFVTGSNFRNPTRVSFGRNHLYVRRVPLSPELRLVSSLSPSGAGSSRSICQFAMLLSSAAVGVASA
jgi:hypothetical protein